MEAFTDAFLILFADPFNIALFVCACLLSFVFGILPGLSGVEAMIILLPFTYSLDMNQSLIMMAGAYSAAGAGAVMTSVLYGIPGSSSSLRTIADGYPLRRQGKAIFAISVATTGSIIAGLLALLIIVFLIPVMGPFSLLFGPAEWFTFVLLGFVTLALAGDAPPLRSLVSTGLGLLAGTVGMSAVSGEARYTLGFTELWGGIPIVAAFVGFFPICECLWIATKRVQLQGTEMSAALAKGQIREGIAATLRRLDAVLLSASVGWVVGIIPGVGSTLASVLGYQVVRDTFSKKEEFGKGAPRGVIGAESADNACVAGALIPALALGIPGGLGTAVLLGVFIIHGVQPGANMFTTNLTATWVILLTVAAATVFSSSLILFGTWRIVRLIVRVPILYLAPVIVFVSLIAVYLSRTQPIDIVFALGLALLAFVMRLYNFSRIGFVIALLLGPVIEQSFVQALSIGRGSYAIFFQSATSLIIWLLIAVTFCLYFMRRKRQAEGIA